MIAMMEAARSRMVSDIDNQEANDNDDNENEGEEEIEAQARRMLSGMEALSGPCGTYAVKEDDGLAVLPFDPRKRNTPSDASLKNAKDPFNLVKRQNIQVVEVGDGVYKLARDGGYVVASDSQLVKVGGPRDSSCRLEGMQDLLKLRKRELEQKLEQLERLSNDLSQRITNAQQEEASYPIISDPPDENDIHDLPHFGSDLSSPSRGGTSAASGKSPVLRYQPELATMSPHSQGEGELMDNSGTTEASSPSPQHSNRHAVLAPNTPNTIDNSDLVRMYADENIFPGVGTQYLCSPFSFLSDSQDSDEPETYISPNRSFERPSSIPPRNSQQTRNQYAPGITRNSSLGSVDFSTGLSGHRALLSTKTARVQATVRQIRFMGEHRGIGTFRGPLRKTQNSASLNSTST